MQSQSGGGGEWGEDKHAGIPQMLVSVGAFGKSRMCKVRRVLAVTQGSGESWTRLATVGKGRWEGGKESENRKSVMVA